MIHQLNGSLSQLVDVLQEHAGRVEAEKLQAVGLRNRAAAGQDIAKMRGAEAHSRLAEKQRELERLRVEYDTLEMHRQEQELMIAKLSSTS